MEELVEEDDDEGGDDELDDEEEADAGAEVGGLAVETREDGDGSLAERDDKRKHCVGRAISGSYDTSTIEKRRIRFCAPLNNTLSSFKLKSTSTRLAPARSCMIMPEVTMGVIPSSMRVPRLDARMTRIQ